MIKIIVAGCRDFADYEYVCRHLAGEVYCDEVVIVSGGCDDAKNGVLTFTRKDGSKVFGADGLGERFANEYQCEVKIFPADWKKFGRSAGPIRNSEMVKYADKLMVFWDGKSKGTGDIITKARRQDIKVQVYDIST